MNDPALPDLAEVLGRVLPRVAREHQPLLIALAERMAADRYRAWTNDAAGEHHRARLLACAAREEQIAGRIEALYPGAAGILEGIRAENVDLEEINRTLFAGRPLRQQLAIQAQGERLGAATWRAFARHESDPARSAVFVACAALEEESALVLDAILDQHP